VNGFIQKYMLTKGKRSEKDKFFKLETEMLNQDASASKAMVQAAEVEVNRLKPCGQKYYQ
jgi:membrane fusion protein (multidrug efflux system)